MNIKLLIRRSSFLCAVFANTSYAENLSGPYEWSGVYIGANLGVIWTGNHITAINDNFLNDTSSYNYNIDAIDVDPGFQFGYMQQIAEHWVVGAEADFSYPATNSKYAVKTSCCTQDTFNVRNNLQGSMRLRAGYAIDRVMPFITAGLSFESMGLYYNNEHNEAYNKSTTQTGWVLGAGVEYGVLDNLSARLEYLYTDYGSALNMNLPTIDSITDPQGSADVKISTNLLRAAVNCRF